MSIDRRPTVALIWGGRGYESDVSRRGMENILPLIDRDTYNVLSLFIDKSGRWLIGDKEVFPFDRGFYCPKTQEHFKIDCAIPLLHGNFGEDGRVQGTLDCADIPYVGCDAQVSAICRDKSVVKAVAEGIGIPTMPGILVAKNEQTKDIVEKAEKKIGYPLFVKPTSLGSSVGASGAENKDELIYALKEAFAFSDRVIIEKRLSPKRELECGYFKAKGKEVFTKCGEILCSDFYSYDKKYSSPDIKIRPVADVDDETNRRIENYSRKLILALGVRDISRIDYFLSGGELYFNEINTMPGQTEGSLYSKMLEASGIAEGEFINLLIEQAINRR